jgi:hypothetical protein
MTETENAISLTADPDYAALVSKRNELTAEVASIESEIKTLRRQIAKSPVPLSSLKRNVRVAEILGDPDPQNVPDLARIPPMRQRVADLQFALAELNRRINTARYRASTIICERARDEHAARVADLAKALIAAHRANAEYRRFADRLNDADIVWTGHLRPMHPRSIKLDDDLSRTNTIATWLKEAVQHGYIAADMVPEELGGTPPAASFFTRKAAKK